MFLTDLLFSRCRSRFKILWPFSFLSFISVPGVIVKEVIFFFPFQLAWHISLLAWLKFLSFCNTFFSFWISVSAVRVQEVAFGTLRSTILFHSVCLYFLSLMEEFLCFSYLFSLSRHPEPELKVTFMMLSLIHSCFYWWLSFSLLPGGDLCSYGFSFPICRLCFASVSGARAEQVTCGKDKQVQFSFCSEWHCLLSLLEELSTFFLFFSVSVARAEEVTFGMRNHSQRRQDWVRAFNSLFTSGRNWFTLMFFPVKSWGGAWVWQGSWWMRLEGCLGVGEWMGGGAVLLTPGRQGKQQQKEEENEGEATDARQRQHL